MTQQLYIVTLRWNTLHKPNYIKMLRAFFPSIGLGDAKEAAEKLMGNLLIPGQSARKSVQIAVTGEEYANFWVIATPGMFGENRVTNIQPLVMPKFYRPQ